MSDAPCPSYRFTPTGVGTIRSSQPGTAGHPVHPHGRGDNWQSSTRARIVIGSPPRAWGQSPRCSARRCCSRFTPTGVGTMQRASASVGVSAVHPHGRGDNAATSLRRAAVNGSPPRAWGQSVAVSEDNDGFRFTPTGVGTMLTSRRTSRARSVHPHGRGDNDGRSGESAVRHGSPPRAWGQSDAGSQREPRYRFTPTGVGTISGWIVSGTIITVHPHGRGDNFDFALCVALLFGSPPRAWGQCNDAQAVAELMRFTPTGVGTMEIRRIFPEITSVHPHGRGDNWR